MSHFDKPFEGNPSVQHDWATRNALEYQARQLYEIRRALERIAAAIESRPAPSGDVDGGTF